MDLNKFGEFIRSLRKEKGFNQEQLADELHVHRTTVVKWEQGKSLPLNDTLVLLSEYFNVSVDELLAGERLSSEASVEEKNKVVLSLLTSRRKSIRTIRYILILSFILIISFFTYYFFTTYNTIHVYLIHGEGEKYKTRDSLLIVSNDKVYLRIGKIESTNGDKNLYINKVDLYVDNEYNTELLFTGDPNEILMQNKKNIEVLNASKLKNNYDNFYLVINYGGDEEIIKLDVIRDFRNKSLFTAFKDDIGNNYDYNPSIKLNKDFVYNDESDTYNLKKDNVEIACASDLNSCRIYVNGKNCEIKYEYYFYDKILTYTSINNDYYQSKITINTNDIDDDEKQKIYNDFKINFLDKYLS